MSHYHHTTAASYGLVAEYDDPDKLLVAAKRAYKQGYRKLDAYSPIPIHGLAEAIGFKKTVIPMLTLIGGLAGAVFGFSLQVIGHVFHYPYHVGGKPLFSWPAFIPITFECMILFSAFTCGISMLVLNGFPRPHHPIFNAPNFDRASTDRFFLCIEAHDTRYDAEKTRSFLQSLTPKPLNVSEIRDE